MNPAEYFLDYFETGHFTLYFLLFLIFLSLLKYLRIPRPPAKIALLLILSLGLFLRIAWLGFSTYEPKTVWDDRHMLESDAANVHAVDLTEGIWFQDPDGKPSARRPIGYPMLLGLLYKIFGVHSTVIWAANLALFIAAAFLLYCLGKEFLGENAGLLAALFFSVYPVSVYSIKLVTDEHLFLPLWYAGLWLLFREVQGKKLPGAVLWYGLIFGYATMTRTHTIFMPVVVGLAYKLARRSWRRSVLTAMGVLIVMQLINLPWVIRNYKAWGVPVLYTAEAGHYIYANMNFSAIPEGGGHVPQKGEAGYDPELERAYHSGNHGVYNAMCYAKIREWILQNPGRTLLLGSCRLLYFMRWDRSGGVWPIWFQYSEGSYDPAKPISPETKEFLQEAAFAAYYALLFSSVFGLIGIRLGWKRLSESSRIFFWVIAASLFFWGAEHMIIFPDRKYRFPIEPLMMLLAAPFWEKIAVNFRWEKIGEAVRGRRRERAV